MPESNHRSTEPAIDHLEEALEYIEDREARYHLRQALQILASKETGGEF